MLLLYKLFIFGLLLSTACHSGDRNENRSAGKTINSESGSKNGIPTAETYKTETPAQDTLYQISGTEPFWHMLIARRQIMYSSMEGDTLYFGYREPRQASGRQQGHVQVFELGAGQQLILRRSRDCPCFDGMSSKEYPYQATLILKEKVLEGCGRSPEKH
jgi:uncharacterized membrane protein